MILDEAPPSASRHDVRQELDDRLNVPFDPEEAREFQADIWARKNIEASEAMGMGGADDPFVAQPVNR